MLCMKGKGWCSILISILEVIETVPIDPKDTEHIFIEPK